MREDQGNVTVEFVGIVIALLVPLCYLGSACWDVARVQLALRGAAHSASRAYVLSVSGPVASRRVATVVATSLADAGVAGGGVQRRVSCSRNPCLTPGGYVTVTLSRPVQVRVPALGPLRVLVHAADTSVVDVYR